tara:strand:+ start:328 stop:2100 length:1773 start_codon:yes stop_codon:yes gene_type:complete
MAAELEAILTANIKDLESQLNKAEKKLAEYGSEVDKQAKKGSKGFTTVGKSAANAVPSVQEFSRVIQDAPFGIQGVGNNIQQLTANFGHLSKSAGGTIPALKLMLASLSGPAGILLAVSVVTSALTFFSGSLGKSKTEAEKLAEAQKKMAESLENYRNALTGVNRVRVEGNRGAAEELVQLKLLRGQIENTNNSMELRKDGIKQLQKEYPTYFKNVKEESLLNGSLKTTYDKLTESIIKRAKATAASDLLVANAKKEILLQSQLDELNANIAKNDAKRADARDKFAKSTQQSYLLGINPAAAAYTNEIASANSLLKEQADLQGQLADIAKENDKLTAFVGGNITIDPNIQLSEKAKEKFKNTFTNLDKVFAINDNVQKALDKFQPDFTGFDVKMNKLGDIIGFALTDSVSKIKPQLSRIEEAFIDFDTNLSGIIENNITNTFASIGEAIGKAMVEGGNLGESLAKALLGSIGAMLTQLGELAIATGVGILAVKTALQSLNPYVAIAAGVALVALGSAFSAGANKIGSSGGTSSVSGQGSSSGSSFSSGSSYSGGVSGNGKVVFEIRGTSLIGVLRNTVDSNTRLGGSLSI